MQKAGILYLIWFTCNIIYTIDWRHHIHEWHCIII